VIIGSGDGSKSYRCYSHDAPEWAPLVGSAAVGLDTIAHVEPKKTAYRYIHFKQACRPSIKGDHALAYALQVFEALISNVTRYEVFRMLETLLANIIDETQDCKI